MLISAAAILTIVGCGGPEAEAPPSDASTQKAMSKFDAGSGGQSETPKGGSEKPTTDQ